MYQVVIVEDDPMVSYLNQTFIEKDPRFQVSHVFQDGRTALDWLTTHSADLVVLDVYMPLLTGLDLLHELRYRGIAVDVIMVTAANDTKTVDALFKLGIIDYLVKPFTCERLQQGLDTFCRHREAVDGHTTVSQETLDRLLAPAVSTATPPPKGYQESTLERIRACLRDAPASGLPSESLARKTGLSVVTARHYVNYLVERGEVLCSVNYDTGGRPCRLYHYPGLSLGGNPPSSI